MPSAYTWPQGRLTVIASALALASVALPASAGARAPIVYAYNGAASPAPASKPANGSGKVDKAAQRIEFRYPGSTAPAGRVEMASAGVPQAAPPVVEQAYTQLPQFAPSATSLDAAAAAPQIAAPVVATAALEPLAMPKPMPAPAMSPASFTEQGVAIVYGDEFAGLPTANGEIFDQAALTAAHPSLPLPSLVEVTNPANGKQVIVRVNDRGPFEDDAMLQVSRQVARELGFDGAGKATLTLKVLGAAPVAASLPVYEPKPVLFAASVTTQTAADELLGGDELAGGTSWTASPDLAPKPRAEVEWPEPPADWGVAPAKTKVTVAPAGSVCVPPSAMKLFGVASRSRVYVVAVGLKVTR